MQATNRRSWLMRVLRLSPVPLLLCLAGGALMAVSTGLRDRVPRTDSFAVLKGRGSSSAVRLDLPLGWSVRFRSQKNGAATRLFTPDGEFAFEVRFEPALYFQSSDGSWQACGSLEEFLREKRKQGSTVEERTTDAGPIGVAEIPNPEVEKALLTTYYSPHLCLTFILREPNFEPEAYRLFRRAEILSSDDPRADNLLPDVKAGERKQLLWDVGYHLLVLGGVGFIALLWGGVYLQVVEASRGMPGLRAVEQPAMAPEPARKWEALKRALSGLGLRHDGWFSLDDFDETHVSL
jgi:hypothetical protein